MKLLVATTNPGKLVEYRSLLAGLTLDWLTLTDIGLDGSDVEETGSTFTENALLKARTYSQRSGLAVLSDDSGLRVDALDGAPGIYSARYAPTASERIDKLLTALQGVPDVQRGAQFVCVVAVVVPTGVTIVTEGIVHGTIGHTPVGENGFGYDPIFRLPDGRSVGELAPAEKDTISHRGVAVGKLRPLLAALAAHG